MGCHIQVKDLSLSYTWKSYSKKLFSDLFLCFETGSYVTVIGGNGSGKSSLLKLLLGLVTPDQGTVHLDGQVMTPGYPHAVRYGRIAYFSQEIESLFFSETVREELGYDQNTSLEEYHSILKLLSIDHLLDQSIENLSGGERQSLVLAQFMLQEAPLLILDEPSSYLDRGRARILKDFLAQSNAAGKTIIHVTQYEGEIKWGDSVLDLDQEDIRIVTL